ncbi:TPA: hypothetical protein JAD51_000837 [Proteus mirabilis]|nr:hypothetical protein [Proteus mirabilis]HEK0667790.1 hypothetical protein [Proteus mirabilis]
MKIIVKVTDGELMEMELTTEQLEHSIVVALDAHRDYAGFNVEAKVVDWDDEEVFAS